MASSGQLEFPGSAPEVPDLTRYRWILANLSGGKDSQAMLVELMRHARAPGVVDRIVVVHADLGDAEWEAPSSRPLSTRRSTGCGSRSSPAPGEE
ncbi:hypothetical protein [Streptomyces griseus]|uniref:hypothetical protein n=1 Tax=Streptomyces griseus TaxID=1911 RepID=UPI0037A99CFB